jgi:hypothetical protein
MSSVYPLHLQRKIDRRWLQRLEEAASVRSRRKVIGFLREAAITHKDCDVGGLPLCSMTASEM